jgi:hypothetical protein
MIVLWAPVLPLRAPMLAEVCATARTWPRRLCSLGGAAFS